MPPIQWRAYRAGEHVDSFPETSNNLARLAWAAGRIPMTPDPDERTISAHMRAASTEPLSVGRYERSPQRRTRHRSSPLDPDWLLQRLLADDVTGSLAVHARGRVLDLGCGGRPYEECAPAGVRWFGADAPGSTSHPDAWSLAHALPFAAGSFSTVLCTQVLEHLADPGAALCEVGRVLEPGGKLILSAPQSWFLHEEPYDFYRYTRFGLDHLCRDAGLVPIEWKSQGGFFAMVGIFFSAHLGSYARWAAERGRDRQATRPIGTPRWRRLLAPLRWPMALVNIVFAALDAIPHPGIFAVNHLVVAQKTPAGLQAR